jgi:hypothetical protein
LALVVFFAFGFAAALGVLARALVVVVRFLAGFLVAALCSSSKGWFAGSVIEKGMI